MVMTYVFGALAGLVWGMLCAGLNCLITKKAIDSGSTNLMLASNMLRTLVDIIALGTVFLVRNIMPFSFVAAIVATAASISITTIVFAFRTAGKKD